MDNIIVVDLFGIFSGKTQNGQLLNIKDQNATTQDEIDALRKKIEQKKKENPEKLLKAEPK